MPGDPAVRLARDRRRRAILAAALLFFVSAYAFLLSLPGRDPRSTTNVGSDATVMAGVLIAVSTADIAAALRPSRCGGRHVSTKRAEASGDLKTSPGSFRLVAHHCNCGRFADHVLRVAGQDRCAGCLGMAAGGIAGIGMAVALGAGLFFPSAEIAIAMVFLGAAASTGGLFQVSRQQSLPGLHAVANLALVGGMVLITAILATRGLLAGALGLSAALAVVGLRIEASRLRHLSVFLGCPARETCPGASALAESARSSTRR